MFSSFFYHLRARGLDVSLNEWLTLLEGLERGLHRSSLSGFYRLCQAVLLKSEADYDRFDQAFLEFFKDVPFHGEIPEKMMEWLNHPVMDLRRSLEFMMELGVTDEDLETLLRRMEERIKEQDSEHNGGKYWVGTQGFTPWGNSGWHANGIRAGGQSVHHTAMAVAGERKYRDFRKDNTLDTRQFQVAFRTLRQLSAQVESSELELDVDGTIRDTGDKGGLLTIRYQKPRKNTIKVLLLMDSGGSIEYFSGLCSMLFQAATKSNTFKELHTYYFHNCIFEELYTDPRLRPQDAVSTEWVLNNYDSSYKVIMVGDASMNPYELFDKQYNWITNAYAPSGQDWLNRFKNRYPYLIWLNPKPRTGGNSYWAQTHNAIAEMLDMYQLSAEGLEQGMKRLMVRK